MPNRRQQQHHRNQRPQRRKAPADTSLGSRKPKPPFPMSLFTSTNLFMAVGLFVMIGGLLLTFVFAQGQDLTTDDLAETPPTNTPTVDPDATPGATTTPRSSEDLQFAEPEQVIDPEAADYRATFVTEKGEFVVEFFDDIAPNTVNSFVFLAQEGFFDGITFHREVPPEEGIAVIQGGDPTGRGTGGPGYAVEEEPNDLLNERGTIAMAKASGATSFGSQFFINRQDNPALDQEGNRFYPFGEVIDGMDVVDELTQGDLIEQVTIETVEGGGEEAADEG